MYIDKEMELPKNLPHQLVEYINDMEDWLDKALKGDMDAEGKYLMHEEALEGTIKQLCICGRISEKDLDTLFRKFGWRC